MLKGNIAVLACLIALLIAGCGGHAGISGISGGTGGSGRSTGSTGGISGQGNSVASLAAIFSVDVTSGKVSVVSPTGTLAGAALKRPSLFTGNSIGFTSSVLSNDSVGNTGLRFLQVSITNSTDLPIGVGPNGNATGHDVIFGAFNNTTGISSQESNTNVSSFAGTSAGYSDGASSVAKFYEPTGVAIGSDGSVYVADSANCRIRKISGGYVSTLAGSGTAGEVDGPATKAEFDSPYSIAVYTDGSLIVADYAGNKIRRVTTAGVVNTVAGTGAAGSANGAGNAATFTNPSGVAVDPSGIIYVSEASSNRIRKITLTGSPSSSADFTVSSFAGSGTAGLLDGNGTAAQFSKPYGLTTDSTGDLYVADYQNNVVRRVDPSANVTTIAGTGVQADLDGYGNAAEFNRPIGVAYLNGGLFVTEASGELVREVVPVPGAGITSTGWAVMSLAGESAKTGDANGVGSSATFDSPRYIAASSSSSLYVADLGNNQIRRVNPSTGSFPIGAPTGATNTSGDLVVLSNPTGIVDGSDLGQAPYIQYALSGPLNPGQTTAAQAWNFVIPSGVTSFQFQVLVQTSLQGLLPLSSGTGVGSSAVDVSLFSGSVADGGFQDGNANEGRYNAGSGLATDANGIIYVADQNNNAIRRVDRDGTVTTIAGVDGSGPGSTNGFGSSAQFRTPEGIAVNAAGTEIFVADTNNDLIREMELTGPDPTNAQSWTVSTIGGTAGSAGDVNGAGTAATFNSPTGIALSPSGLVYISESAFGGGDRIRQLQYLGGARDQASDWRVITIAGNGTSGYVNGPGTGAEFYFPSSLCCDPYGNVYIADFYNSVVRKMDPTGNVSTFAGPAAPTATFGYKDGAGSSAEFDGPWGVCSDSAGYIYVADTSNEIVRRISPSGVVSTIAGIENETGPVYGSGATAELPGPFGITVTPWGDLYVSSNDFFGIIQIQAVFDSAAGKAPKPLSH